MSHDPVKVTVVPQVTKVAVGDVQADLAHRAADDPHGFGAAIDNATSALIVKEGDEPNVEVKGGPNNSLSGTRLNLLVGGGSTAQPNVISGTNELQTVVGGYDNTIDDSLASSILGSMHGDIASTANHALIVGGSTHSVSGGSYGSCVGGFTGTASADYAATLGGNTPTASGLGAVALGGSTAKATGDQSVVLGGGNAESAGNRSVVFGQDVTAKGQESLAGGLTVTNEGRWSVVIGSSLLNGTAASPTRGDYSAMLGGLSNSLGQTLSARFSGVVGGRDNTSDAEYTAFVGGQDHTISAAHAAVVAGQGHTLSHAHSAAVGGKGAQSRHVGVVAQAMGQFATAGDAQAWSVVLRRESTGTTTRLLLLDDATRLTLANGQTWAFDILVICKRTDGGAVESAAYRFSGAIKRDAGVATTAFIGTPTKEVLGEDNASYDCSVAADTTNGDLQVNAVGVAGATVRWAAYVRVTEVAS